MCPLRVLLIFLSATLAGFFVLRNLKAQPGIVEARQEEEDSFEEQLSLSTKVRSAIGDGFWTCVDMASGRCGSRQGEIFSYNSGLTCDGRVNNEKIFAHVVLNRDALT
ncbi:hypothetical protein MUK42_12476 [Musa troglodytarum]|uniref:Uncharacterized protein n=1 Tax=Musa troglodytarum TaxID=320322 RepID=A0A9E7GVD1_9LILI|nr:hypothetical protein MUK42_12476 [Musa troglodytarum]